MAKYLAHVGEGVPPGAGQELGDHLRLVAGRAGEFAAAFGAGPWGRAAGLLHDLGKPTPGFQLRLAGGPAVDHSTAGAQAAVAAFGDQAGRLLAYALAGHHAGLPDGTGAAEASLQNRLGKRVEPPGLAARELLAGLTLAPPALTPVPEAPGFTLAFFARMVFSCLADADFLDTEAFLDPARGTWRGGRPGVAELWPVMERFLAGLRARAGEAPLNRQRNAILAACLAGAAEPPGLFSLTVPTGGGKTYASLAFALKHALAHGLCRVIYVIPYTSIIEQNARVFREIFQAEFGDRVVLEHHSNLSRPGGRRARTIRPGAAPAGAENWDAPLVVTTNVQLFESLFAHRPARCRKLHRLARSVIVLDEAQMLPREALLPCLAALRELAVNYGASVLLCTATQPTLADAEVFRGAALAPRELAPDPPALAQAFRRVRAVNEGELATPSWWTAWPGRARCSACQLPGHGPAGSSWPSRPSWLPRTAGVFHLSALMYPGHRGQKLAEIRGALGAGRPSWVGSTQLVEAGVDLDFPEVWRALAGVDSLAQAAGRCNREGRLAGRGAPCLHAPGRPAAPRPAGPLRGAEETLRRFPDPLEPAAVRHFFGLLFWQERDQLDQKHILDKLQAGAARAWFPFAEVAREFAVFASPGEAVLVCPDPALREEIVAGLRHAPHPGKYLRLAQPYTVQLYPTRSPAWRKAATSCGWGGAAGGLGQSAPLRSRAGVIGGAGGRGAARGALGMKPSPARRGRRK